MFALVETSLELVIIKTEYSENGEQMWPFGVKVWKFLCAKDFVQKNIAPFGWNNPDSQIYLNIGNWNHDTNKTFKGSAHL